MYYTPKSELDQRVSKLQKILKDQGIDGAIVIQNADLYYFSGTIQQSHLFIPVEGKPLLLVKNTYERALEESALENIIYLDSLKELLPVLKSHGYSELNKLGFELDVLPANLYFRYQDIFKDTQIVDISQGIRELRMVKSPYELEILRGVNKVLLKLFPYIRENLREGMTELKLAALVEGYLRELGHPGLMRVRGFNNDLHQNHIVSGSNTNSSYFWGSIGGLGVGPAFAQGASTRIIRRNESILTDLGFNQFGYSLDMTRIFCIGQLPDHLTKAYQITVDIGERAKELARPGLPCGELYKAAKEIANASPYANHFLGLPNHHLNFCGHGIGLEQDELPVIGEKFNTPLEPGMIFAFEPKFTFLDGAVGLENTFLVTENGLENMTTYDEGILYI